MYFVSHYIAPWSMNQNQQVVDFELDLKFKFSYKTKLYSFNETMIISLPEMGLGLCFNRTNSIDRSWNWFSYQPFKNSVSRHWFS